MRKIRLFEFRKVDILIYMSNMNQDICTELVAFRVLQVVVKNASKIKEQLWSHPGNILVLSMCDSKKIGKFRENVCHKYQCSFLFPAIFNENGYIF